MKKHTQQTLALAGVPQAAFLVNQLGRHGVVSQDNFATSIHSLFVTSPSTTEEVYGRVSRLNLGLQVLQEIFQGGSGVLKNPDIMRYIFGILYLENKVSKNRPMLNAISEGLKVIENAHPDPNRAADTQVIQQLGAIYESTISTLNFRIQVKGDLNFLKNEITASKIRAVLLAGIRSAVLWQQLGGRRWHLLVHRKRISQDILHLLGNL